jgi:hypothetical protein
MLGEEPVTLTKYTNARGADGRTTTTLASTSTILASVQPMNGDALQLLPEGERTRKGRIFLIDARFQTVTVSAESPADRIAVGGVTYELHRVEHWRAVLPHFEAIGLAVDEATPATAP